MSDTKLKEWFEQVYAEEIAPYLSGKENLFRSLISAYVAGGHALIEGPPGTAKTLIAKLFARIFAKSFRRIQFTTDLLPGEVIGSNLYHPGKGDFTFIEGPIFADVVLADEINRAPPRTQSAFLEAMEERQVTVEGKTYHLPKNFFVIATQNPMDYEGTFALPEVQLDRFIFSFPVDHASIQDENSVLRRHLDGTLPPNFSKPISQKLSVDDLKGIVAKVSIQDDLVDYISRLVRCTRSTSLLRRGASMRASLAIVKGSQVMAALQGRAHVVPDDIKGLSVAAIRHRVDLSSEARMNEQSIDNILSKLLAAVELPKGV